MPDTYPKPPAPPQARVVKEDVRRPIGKFMSNTILSLRRTIMNASAIRHPMKCDTVVIRNVMSNGIIEHPAMVTRRFSDRVINIMVFPDGGHPYPLQDVDFFQSRKEALRYLSVLGNPDKDTKLVAYWPDTLETMGH